MKAILSVMILMMTQTSVGLEIPSPGTVEVESCQVQTTVNKYSILALGACVEEGGGPGDFYYKPNEPTLLLKKNDYEDLLSLKRAAELKGYQFHYKSNFCDDVRPGAAPYIFVEDANICAEQNLLVGCVEYDIYPGFDMPDHYSAPDHLPENAKYFNNVEIKVTETSIEKVCR